MSSLTREQFVQRVIEYVTEKFPLVKLARGQEPFSMMVNGHVASLENLYRVSLLSPNDMRHHVERWMVELLRAAEGRPDDDAPLDDLRERILPMIAAVRRNDPTMSAVMTQPLVEGIQVAYAIDSDRTISYILRSQFDRWKIDPDELHELALNNLVNRSNELAAHAAQDDDGEINLILFQTMDGYDASRILLPTLHDRLREHLGSPFAAAVPNRDILLCFRNDDETVARLKEQIGQDYRQMPHQVTDQLLLVTADGIAMRA